MWRSHVPIKELSTPTTQLALRSGCFVYNCVEYVRVIRGPTGVLEVDIFGCHCAAAAAATLLLLLLAAAAAATGASAAAALLLLLPPPPPQLPLRLPRCSSGRVGQRNRGRWMVTADGW